MKKTKKNILETALRLYNKHGVSSISIRQIANEAQISHSNLIYHFPTHEEIVLALHDQLLEKAIELNQKTLVDQSLLKAFFESTKIGFGIVYDYQFLFLDLHHLCTTYPKIKKTMLSVEEVRSAMYRGLIEKLIAEQLMRAEEFDGEFAIFIDQIKLFSDHWLVSSAIYDSLETPVRIEKYAYHLLNLFYPYLLDAGKTEFNTLRLALDR